MFQHFSDHHGMVWVGGCGADLALPDLLWAPSSFSPGWGHEGLQLEISRDTPNKSACTELLWGKKEIPNKSAQIIVFGKEIPNKRCLHRIIVCRKGIPNKTSCMELLWGKKRSQTEGACTALLHGEKRHKKCLHRIVVWRKEIPNKTACTESFLEKIDKRCLHKIIVVTSCSFQCRKGIQFGANSSGCCPCSVTQMKQVCVFSAQLSLFSLTNPTPSRGTSVKIQYRILETVVALRCREGLGLYWEKQLQIWAHLGFFPFSLCF